MEATVMYRGERWNVLETTENGKLLWLPGRKERFALSEECR